MVDHQHSALHLFKAAQQAFTLIELSIVLVIIGLIVGGVLAGQDLIRAAEVRAQIAQIEKYNTAVNTFREKYGGIPGDMNASTASTFAFAPRGQYAGEGDGNGVLEGVSADGPGNNEGGYNGTGETTLFWVDLSQARLIDGSFNTAQANVFISAPVSSYLPSAKLGSGNYIYVYSWNGTNYFGVSAVTAMVGGSALVSYPNLTVLQAYNIDSKIDDGLPQSGAVTALYVNAANYAAGPIYAAGGVFSNNGDLAGSNSGAFTGYPPNLPTTAATNGNATTCYDNGDSAGQVQRYSLSQGGGNDVNCALSFRFQ